MGHQCRPVPFGYGQPSRQPSARQVLSRSSRTLFRGWVGEMPHRGRHHGEGDLEAADDRLSADRLADLVGTLRTSSPDSAVPLPRGESQDPPAAEPHEAPGADKVASGRMTTDKVAPGNKAGASAPTPAGSDPASAGSDQAAPGAAVSSASPSAPAASKDGRHRRTPTAKLMVRGFALTTYRLALMGALTFLLVAAAILKSLS